MKRFLYSFAIAGLLVAQNADELESKSRGEAALAARAWVHDRDPRHRAWAAHWAGRDDLAVLIPDLIQDLNSYTAEGDALPDRRPLPDGAAVQAIADALIRVKADVPGAVIMKLYPEFPAQALILLARSGDDTSVALYRIFEDAKITNVWLGAANLLAVNHPELLARPLLEEFRARTSIRVIDSNQRPDDTSHAEGGCDSVFITGPAYGQDWPKIREYSLATDQSLLLAPGRTNLYYFDWESPDYVPHPDTGSCDSGRKQSFLYRLLQQLARSTPTTFALQQEASRVLKFSSETQYRRDVQVFVRLQRRAFDDLIQKFIQQGILKTGNASSLKLHIAMSVEDKRSRQRPLPAIDFAELGVVE